MQMLHCDSLYRRKQACICRATFHFVLHTHGVLFLLFLLLRKLLSTIVQQIGSHQVHHLHLDRIDSETELYTNWNDLAENVPEFINRI